MGVEAVEFLETFRIPQANKLVGTAGSQQLAVRGIRKTEDPVLITSQPFDTAYFLAAGHVPKAKGLVDAARGQRLAIGCKRDSGDGAEMPQQAMQPLACGNIPEMQGPGLV